MSAKFINGGSSNMKTSPVDNNAWSGDGRLTAIGSQVIKLSSIFSIPLDISEDTFYGHPITVL